MSLDPLRRLSTQDAVKLLAAAVVGYVAITGRQVDPLILTALLSLLAITPAPHPKDANHAEPPPDQETTE